MTLQRRLAPILAMLLLAGCASQPDPKPAICDGHHRRPANPNGTTLPSLPALGAAPAPSVQVTPPPKPSKGPGPQSSIDPRAYAPCGMRA